jgi:hypothetical protein
LRFFPVNLLVGPQRKAVALLVLVVVGLVAWETMDPGQLRWLVMVLLGGFALRILLTTGSRERSDTRYDDD